MSAPGVAPPPSHSWPLIPTLAEMFKRRPDDAVVAIDAALSRDAIDARAWSIETHPDAPWIPDPTLGMFPNICLAEGAINPADPPGFYYVCTRIPHQTGRHAAGSFGRLVAVWGEAS